MPLIKNKTSQLLVFAGVDPETGEQFPTVAIPQGKALEVSDDQWAIYKDRPSVEALLASGRCLVLGGSVPTAPAPVVPTAKPVEPVAEEPAAASDDEPVAWADMHYKKCQAQIAKMEDTAELYTLLEDETRPAVKSALESRIEELEG